MFDALRRIRARRRPAVPPQDPADLGRRLRAAGILRDPAALDPDSFAFALALAGVDVAQLGDEAFGAAFRAIAGRAAAAPAA
ncbi:MAG: hypothetical protein KJZ85_09965 [Rhodobacteraceae bacterium]|jgi:hypothetical protein|nr:hypothetical protein [Paracoccaceae bacterium]